MVRKLKPRIKPTLRRLSPRPRVVATQGDPLMKEYLDIDYTDEQVEEMYEEIDKGISLEILERSRMNWDAKAIEMFANWITQKSQVVEERAEPNRQMQIKQYKDQFVNCKRSAQVLQVKIEKLRADLAKKLPPLSPLMPVEGDQNGETV